MSRYNKFILFSDEMKKKLSKDYKKKKSAVQEIAEYLRQRSYIDGTRVFMENPTQYKHWSFLYFITYTMQYEIQNYFGVIYDEHGVKGDTMFPDFYSHFTARPIDYWRNNAKDLLLMRQYFREMYLEKLGRFITKEDQAFYDNMLVHHQRALYHKIKKRKDARDKGEECETNVFDQLKDVMFETRQNFLKEHFDYLKESRNQSKKKRVRKVDRDSSKTMQSENALRSMLDPRMLMNDRFSMQFAEGSRNAKSVSCNSYMIVWDHKLQKEHWLYKVMTTDMDSDLSIWNGVEDLKIDIQNLERKTYLPKPTPAPIIDHPNPYYGEKALDMRGGGWISDGTDGNISEASTQRDTISSILAGGETILTERCCFAVGKGSTFLGAKILWNFMRQKEFEAILYDRKS